MQTHFDQLPPDQQTAIRNLVELLRQAAQTTNLTAIRDPESIMQRHVEDALAVLPLLKKLPLVQSRSHNPENAKTQSLPLRLIDIGSGAGLPALVLAIALPEWEVVSVESRLRKTEFQKQACQALSLTNVRVLTARAEDLAHDPEWRERGDLVVARALAPLNRLLELLAPFVRIDGHICAWKGPQVALERDTGMRAAVELGLKVYCEHPYALEPSQEESLRLMLLQKHHPTPDRYPRKPAAIRKRPLGEHGFS